MKKIPARAAALEIENANLLRKIEKTIKRIEDDDFGFFL